jgi:hypothetical protein
MDAVLAGQHGEPVHAGDDLSEPRQK